MPEIPRLLLDQLLDADKTAAVRWWLMLEPADRALVEALYDPRNELCFFGADGDEGTAPQVISGYLSADDNVGGSDDWVDSWRQYLVEHPEMAVMSAYFGSRSWLFLGLHLNVWVDWGRTRFRPREMPPSEQWRGSHRR